MIKTLVAALLLVVGPDMAPEVAEPRQQLPAVVVVGSQSCGPCRRLHIAWGKSRSPAGAGYAWRVWIERRFRVEFVDWESLPETERNAVKSVPAVFIGHPTRRGRDGPFPLAIGSEKHAVASFGSMLYRKTSRNAKR